MAHLPTVLYHYTSQVGLLGILQKKELWATQIQYLNDCEDPDRWLLPRG